MAIQQVLYFILFATATVDCAKILILATTPSPSLFNLFKPIISRLAERNHDITVQSYYPLKNPPSNVKEIILQEAEFGNNEEMTKDFLMTLAKAGPIGEVSGFSYIMDSICQEYIEDPSTKALVKDGKHYDLVLLDGFADCTLVVGSMLAKHVSVLYGSGNCPWHYSDVPAPPSYIPHYFRRLPSSMTFWQRLQNAVETVTFRLIGDWMLILPEQKKLSEFLPQAPTIHDARSKITLTLANTDPVLYSPRPSMPNTINCGGLHCTDAKPLPKDLNDFVESSGDEGFIMFGLGTNVKSKFLPLETRNAIISAFSRLKQKVIWKFEAQLDNLPKNVMITKFMPQQDLLGHPKLRLFVTHSGLLSLQEAVYHGVPVIGMPFFMDQSGNIARIQELGIGEYMDFANVTADGLFYLINKVLKDNSYRANAKKYSAIFKDQPVKPLDNAIFWLEYVLRHDGMTHFRPASADLNLFQYFLLDVIAFVLLIAVLAMRILYFVLRLLYIKLIVKKQKGSVLEKKRK